MQSRAKWWLLPIAALVVVGGATGWWGYGQYTGKQALAAQIQTQYSHSFHALIGHVHDMQDEVQKAQVSGDQEGFQTHLRSIWRLSDLAAADVARLPLNLMPMHHTQQFLGEVGIDTDQWLRSDTNHTSASVTNRLQWMNGQSTKILQRLNQVDQTTGATKNVWTGAVAALASNGADNQVVDGFHKLDASVGGYPEAKQAPPSVLTQSNAQINREPVVSQADAKKALTSAIGRVDKNDLVVRKIESMDQPVWTIDSKTNPGLYAEVSVHGGHLLSFRRPNQTAGSDRVDLGHAADDAQKWLKGQGFASTDESQSHIFDHVAYFVWAPVVKGATVVDHDITVAVSLQNGKIVGYNAKTAILDPVTSVGPRKYTLVQLKKGIKPSFEVRESHLSVIKSTNGKFIPTASFFGLYKDQPYRVDMNAQTGHEANISRLPSIQ